MKKLRANMDRYFNKVNERWKAYPLRQQRRYTLYFFAVYLILTAGVIFKAWHDKPEPGNPMMIEHTESPVFKRGESPAILHDTIPTILKENSYERK